MKISRNILLLLACILFIGNAAHAGKNQNSTDEDRVVLQRISDYRNSVRRMDDTIHTNLYFRYFFNTVKRNFTLRMVPSMYAISKGQREYAGETFNEITMKDNTIIDLKQKLNIGTIPHNRKVMSALWKFLTPDIYDITIFQNLILSPLNIENINLYKYYMTMLTEHRLEIVFRPKRYNTQLISGSAIIDWDTGKIISIRFTGEYDMIRFTIHGVMGKEGAQSLYPKTCDVNAIFHFIGNKIAVSCGSVYGIEASVAKPVSKSGGMKIMDKIRPDSLPEWHKKAYEVHDSIKSKRDSLKQKKEDSKWDKALWDFFGDYVINRTKGNFGPDDQGAFRISPILNPLYLSYSKRKGITYKLKIRGSYNFSLNKELSLRFDAGYSFKQKQLYFKSPIRFTYDKSRNGYVEMEIGQGNRISNSDIVDQVKNESLGNIDWSTMNLDYFKDFYTKTRFNHDIGRKWGVQLGFVYHRRSAVDKTGFELANRPSVYMSFAPTIQIQFRPFDWTGPIITTDYERGIKIGKAETEYERYEFDLSWKKEYHSLKCLSIRGGGGFYTSRSSKSYFLDYSNFKDVNIPGGWNDDWSGEFQLLNSNWYNASEYYARANITYESPLMVLSRIPYIGKIMEMERIYINTLFVEHLHPYIEYGYGFTNRFFSMGIFAATRNHKFDGFGCRFGLEIFRDW